MGRRPTRAAQETLSLLPALLWLAACRGPLTCEVGTGYEAFVPLAEGDDVEIVFGPQGGWHIFTSVRYGRHRDEVVVLRGQATLEDGSPLGWGFESWYRGDPVDGWSEANGLLNLLDDGGTGLDQPIDLAVTVTDGQGEQCTDTRRVFARDQEP